MARTSKKSSSKSSGPPKFTGAERIVVLHGDEAFLQTRYLVWLREAIQKKTGDEVETFRYDGKSAALSDVLDELRSFSLVQQPKLVVVDQADPFVTQHREALERYAEKPEEMATLVLRPNSWNRQWKLHKAIEKVGLAAKCERPQDADAERWLVGHAKQAHAVKLDPRAASLMIDHLGADLGRLDSELAKLAANAGDDQSITVEHVETLAGRASDEKAWEIQAALLSGDANRALSKLHELIDLSAQPDVLVGYFVGDLVRKLHHAAAKLDAGTPQFQVCKELKVWGERQKPFVAAARKLGTRGAARLLRNVVEMDSRSKSGLGDMTTHLERFCIQFTTAVR